MNFCSGVVSPKSMNLLAKVGYNLAKVIPFGKTSNDLAKPLYNLAKPYTIWQKSVVLPNCIGFFSCVQKYMKGLDWKD